MLNGFQAYRILLCFLFCFVLFVCLFFFFTMAGLDGAKIFVQLTLSW